MSFCYHTDDKLVVYESFQECINVANGGGNVVQSLLERCIFFNNMTELFFQNHRMLNGANVLVFQKFGIPLPKTKIEFQKTTTKNDFRYTASKRINHFTISVKQDKEVVKITFFRIQ